MHTAIYLVSFLLYKQIKPLDYHTGVAMHRSERFFAALYGIAIFITLLITDSWLIFFRFGRPYYSHDLADITISISIWEAAIVSSVLSFLFFFTVRLGGSFLAHGTFALGMLFLLPGLLINSVAAYLLISMLG